jgi:hypothetical protein
VGDPRAPYIYVGFGNTSEVGVYRLTAAVKLEFVTKVADRGTGKLTLLPDLTVQRLLSAMIRPYGVAIR